MYIYTKFGYRYTAKLCIFFFQKTTCQLGTKQCRSKKRYRVAIFRDTHGHEIRIVTNVLTIGGKDRRYVSKTLDGRDLFGGSSSILFGTIENAVYNWQSEMAVALFKYSQIFWK